MILLDARYATDMRQPVMMRHIKIVKHCAGGYNSQRHAFYAEAL